MESNINVWLLLACPPLRSWPITQACALTGNGTGNPLVCSPALNPLSYTSPGPFLVLIKQTKPAVLLTHSFYNRRSDISLAGKPCNNLDQNGQLSSRPHGSRKDPEAGALGLTEILFLWKWIAHPCLWVTAEPQGLGLQEAVGLRTPEGFFIIW